MLFDVLVLDVDAVPLRTQIRQRRRRSVQRVGRRGRAQPRVGRGLLVALDLGDVARRLERSCSDVLGGHAIGSGAHGVKVVRHRDSDRHRRQLAIGHSLRVVRSAGFVKDLGRQIPRAVRVRAVRICPELRTDVDPCPLPGPWSRSGRRRRSGGRRSCSGRCRCAPPPSWATGRRRRRRSRRG